jgi:hypothetical protein
MNDELEANQEEMENLEVLNQTLLVKERESNDDLQQAHKVLLDVSISKWVDLG